MDLDAVRQAGLDLLCCQSVVAPVGRNDLPRLLADASGLTCSCYVPPGARTNRANQETGGLAILAGAGVWTLNSGTLTIAGNRHESSRLAQFTLVRKGMISLLAFNLNLADDARDHLSQVQGLFAHTLCREASGLVVLCADRRPMLAEAEFAALAERAGLTLHTSLIGADGGFLCLLASRGQYEVRLATSAQALPQVDTTREGILPSGFAAAAFEARRKKQGGKRPFLPLSFREQWLGCREHFRAWAT
jgi:hypothetical protein